MKKKIITILVILVAIIGIIFSKTLDAGTGKLYTRLSALNPDGVGYGIGDPTNKGKYIWHMPTYDSTRGGLSKTQKNIYCLRAEYGASWEEFQGASPILEYNMVFDLQKDREDLSGKIVDNGNDADEIVQNILDETGTQYREILWLLDNMYIVGDTNKEDFLGRAGVKKDVYDGVTEYYNSITGETYGEEVLTDADIIAIQRVAVWTITNGGDYDKTGNKHWLRITTDGENYSLLSESRDKMATDVYKYLVKAARAGASLYTPENEYSIKDAPVTANLSGLTQVDGKYILQVSGSNYMIGPIVLNKSNDLFYDLSMVLKDENGTEINSSNYTITDGSGNELSDVTIKDLVGRTEGFYIKVPTRLANKVNVQIQLTQYNTTKNLWLNGTETTAEVKLNGEQPIAEFSRKPQTTNIEFVVQQEATEVTVTKKWEDNENQDGIRPTSVTVQLLADGVEVEGKTLQLNKENNWTGIFTDLEKELNGTEIAYSVIEKDKPYGYENTVTKKAKNSFTITNKHIPETRNIEVTKNWNDANNQDGVRPNKATVILYENGVEKDRKEITGTGNTWKATFAGLPTKKNGVEIKYTIDEVAVPKYTKTVNGFEITNTYIPEIRDIEITKIWEDENNQDEIRPAKVTAILYADGAEKDRKEVTGTGDTWKATFTGVPVKKQGKDIIYTVDEEAVLGYEKTISGFEITNKHIPGTTSVRVTKVWDDNNDKDGLRTDSVTINLLKNAEQYKTVELSDSNNWQHAFTGLPKKENGTDIIYTIKEITQIEGYTTTAQENQTEIEKQYVITNKHETPKVFDLALRKYITKLNGESLTETRVPNIDENSLKEGTTATYKHRKDPVPVKKGNIVTYAITIYNEGEKPGYATQIIDQLPTGLKYTSGKTVKSTKSNTYQVTYNETTNEIKFDLVNTKENEAQVLQPYKTGSLDKETIEIECEVTASASKEKEQVLTNVAWISGAYDTEGKKVITSIGDDRDSEPGTKPNVDKDSMENYTGNKDNIKDLTNSENYYKGEQDDDDFEKLIIPQQEKVFDLALRKYIIKVNNTEITKLGLPTRVPNISEATLKTGTTATYKHRKEPVEVKENDIVTYAITIYNEGEKAGYASQIIDQLPEGLILIPTTTVKSNKNTYTATYEASTNRVTLNIVNTKENPAQELTPYKEGNLDSETVELQCKVVYKPKAGKTNILTNVAWINQAFDVEANKIITTKVGDDRDSEPATKPNVNKDNMENYKGNKNNQNDLANSEYFYKGEQDDDDFEKLYVKTFDLSLRKFISSVNNKTPEASREPIVDITPLKNKTGTTAIYTHTKTPLGLREGDTIIYTIRVYNEGEIDGYANEVKDYLPPYLTYVANSETNNKYGWQISEDGRIATTKYLSDKEISAFNGKKLDYEDLQIECKISDNAIPNKNITNIAEISEYKYGDTIVTKDIDSDSNNIKENLPEDEKLPDYKKDEENKPYVPGNQDDDDFEKIYIKEFDLSLRKFITLVQDKETTGRVPQVKNENGVISYEHSKDPITVHVGDVVIYTLRIYNEGEIDGYASEITDDIPEYLEYLPEESTNVEYMWKMFDKNGDETEKLEDAVKVKTNYLSKENGEDNLIKAFDGTTLHYKDIKVAFKVKDPNSNTYIITNHAQISDDTDENGNQIKDKDSKTDIWNEGEDDQDIENIKVEYFDLSILKFVSKVIVKENKKETVTQTGYNGHENPEPVVKVELHKKKLSEVVVKFGYGITVTNEGDIPGYATEITDYVPQGLKFDPTDNPEWTDEGNNVISTKQLENVLLQPGESKTIEVILTWINGKDNMALKTNTVEISEDKNKFDVPDRDSTPDNKKDGEDDIDIAKVILAVSTGRTQTYFMLTLGLLTVVATGIVLIKKFVI